MSDSNSTTTFCKKCQGLTARYANGKCKACARVSGAIYLAANPNRAKLWRTKNPEKTKIGQDNWKAANKEKISANNALWRGLNAKKAKDSDAAWRVANPLKVKVRQAKWYVDNPSAHRIHDQNRKARKQERGGVLSKGLASELFSLQKGKCPCCNQPLGNDYHLDHIQPLALGGTNTDDNIQLLRKTCNLQKSMKHPVDFMQSRGFLL